MMAAAFCLLEKTYGLRPYHPYGPARKIETCQCMTSSTTGIRSLLIT
jgi:hypothetical protein